METVGDTAEQSPRPRLTTTRAGGEDGKRKVRNVARRKGGRRFKRKEKKGGSRAPLGWYPPGTKKAAPLSTRRVPKLRAASGSPPSPTLPPFSRPSPSRKDEQL